MGVYVGVTGRGVLVGVNVGAGVEVGTRLVAVGDTVGVNAVGIVVGIHVTVSTTGDGVEMGVGVEGITRLIPQPPTVRQAARVTPVKVRRAAAPQSGGVGTCSRAARISLAV